MRELKTCMKKLNTHRTSKVVQALFLTQKTKKRISRRIVLSKLRNWTSMIPTGTVNS